MTELLPGMLVFGLGLVMTVAPLTATVLAAVDARHAGVASGTNNAIARVAGLIAIAALGAVVAARFVAAVDERAARDPLAPAARTALAHARDRPLVVTTPAGLAPAERAQVRDALSDASVNAFHLGMGVAAGAGRGGRPRGAGRDREPAPPRAGGRLPGRSARGRQPPRRGRRPAGGAAGAAGVQAAS